MQFDGCPKVLHTVSGIRLKDKVALVTGGASGIGQAIACCFAEQGAAIRVVDLNGEAARETAERITKLGGTATAHVCDVTDAANTRAVFQAILGLSHIDILVNSAGVSHVGRLDNTGDDDFMRLFRVNVLGTHHAMQECIQSMVARRSGVIVNLASID